MTSRLQAPRVINFIAGRLSRGKELSSRLEYRSQWQIRGRVCGGCHVHFVSGLPSSLTLDRHAHNPNAVFHVRAFGDGTPTVWNTIIDPKDVLVIVALHTLYTQASVVGYDG